MGKQIHISQMYVADKTSPSLSTYLSLRPETNTSMDNSLQKFASHMTTIDNKFVILKDEGVGNNEYLLGYHDKRWFLAISETCADVAAFCADVSGYVKWCCERYINKDMEIHNPNLQQMPPYDVQHRIFHEMDGFEQIVAKIAFNCLAYFQGNELVLDGSFDPVRQAIYTGIASIFC